MERTKKLWFPCFNKPQSLRPSLALPSHTSKAASSRQMSMVTYHNHKQNTQGSILSLPLTLCEDGAHVADWPHERVSTQSLLRSPRRRYSRPHHGRDVELKRIMGINLAARSDAQSMRRTAGHNYRISAPMTQGRQGNDCGYKPGLLSFNEYKLWQ